MVLSSQQNLVAGTEEPHIPPSPPPIPRIASPIIHIPPQTGILLQLSCSTVVFNQGSTVLLGTTQMEKCGAVLIVTITGSLLGRQWAGARNGKGPGLCSAVPRENN